MGMLDGMRTVFLEALSFADERSRAALVEQWNKECQTVYEYKKQLIAEEHYKAAHNKSGWISVEERLPDGNGSFLTVDEKGYMQVCYWEKRLGWLAKSCNKNAITHWMPLPEAPKGGAE